MQQRIRKRVPTRLRRRSKTTLVLAIFLSLILAFESAPAEARTALPGAGPSLGAIFGRIGDALTALVSPLGTAAGAVSSWFDSTFLTAKQAAAPEQTPVVPGEVPWKRTQTSRTVRNANGSYTVEAFTQPVNYLDQGVWQPIDDTLVASSKLGYDWQNKANAFGVHLKQDLEAKPVALVVDGDTYTVSPQGLAKVKGGKSGPEAKYQGVAAATDLSWSVTPSGLKETITLFGPNAPTEFRFLLEGPSGMKVLPQSDGSAVVETGDGEQAFVFEAPWAQENLPPGEAAAIEPLDRHASLSVTKMDLPAGYEITLTVDSDWLSTPGRRFPVIVDPTLVIQPGIQPGQPAAVETTVQDSCDCSLAASDRLYVGTTNVAKLRSLVQFDVRAVPFYSPVSSAKLELNYDACLAWAGSGYVCDDFSHTINAHRVTAGPWSAWSPSFSWANANYDSAVLDSHTRSTTETAAWHDWAGADVTSLVQKWVNTESPNYGFLLKLSSETLSRGGPAYYSSRGPSSLRPKLTITYTANATHGYPPAAPSPKPGTQIVAVTGDNPAVPASPSRSLLQTTDGVQVAIYQDGCDRSMRTAVAPYQSWTAAVAIGNQCSEGDAAIDTASDKIYTLQFDALGVGPSLKRWGRSGNTWSQEKKTTYDATSLGGLSVVKTSASDVWVAYRKIPIGQTQTRIAVIKSTNNGNDFSGAQALAVDGRARLVALGSTAGMIIQSGSQLSWRTSTDSWASAVTFTDTVDSDDAYQAVVDDQSRVHLVYSTAGGVRYRMREATGTWSPAPSSPGTALSSIPGDVTLSTDGAELTLLYSEEDLVNDDDIYRRTWSNGSWSSPVVTVDDTSGDSIYPLGSSLPQRLFVGLTPFTYYRGTHCIGACDRTVHFDYLDATPPGGSVAYPGEGQVLVTNAETLQVSPVDNVGVQRADFFVDRGGGLLGYLGTDSDPAGGFTYVWNTKEVDGSSKRLWPNGAYRVFAAVWDNKGNRGETNRPLSYIQDQDLGVRPYRSSLPISIGAGLTAQVNLWNGNLTLSHGLLSDPTVIGPLSITRTYNSLDTQNGTAGRGWNAGAELDDDISFSRLIDHSVNAEYPQNVAELVETDDTSHYYQFTSGGTYDPFIDDHTVLTKNNDGSWTLTMGDGGRYTFNSLGDPVDYRTAEQTLDQASFAYAYTAGKLSSIVDPVGRGVTFTYDGNGRLWKLTSNQASPARTWTFTYTGTGELSDVQDPVNGGTTTHFDYDATTKLMTRVTTPAGVRIEFGYDTATPRRVVEVRQLHTDGSTTAYTTKIEYADAQTSKVIRPKGNFAPCSTTPTCKAKYTTTYGMDARYRLTTVGITLPDGTSKTRTITWNDQNLQTAASNFAGDVTTSTYDRAGNLLTQTTPDPDGVGPLTGSSLERRYDEPYQGLQGWYYNGTTLTPPAVLRRLDPQIAFTWPSSPGTGVNADNFSVRWVGYLDVPTLGTYTFYTTADLASRLYVGGRELIDNWTSPVQTERSSAKITMAAGLHPIIVEMNDTTGTAAATLAWEGPGIGKQTIPSAKLKPGFNLQTGSVDELGNVTTHVYEDETPPNYTNDQDPFYGRLIEQTQTNTPAGGTASTLRTTFTYNSFGQRTSKTTPRGNTGGSPDTAYTTTYSYYGAAESATHPCTSSTYPQLGLLKSISQPGLATKTHIHDGAGNVVALTEGKGTTCSDYDGLGRQISMKSSDRSVATTYSYDRDGRQTGVADPTLPSASMYTFDDLGRLSTAKDALAPAGEQPVVYTYDEHGNAITRVDKTGSTAYTVDELDRVTKLTDPAQRDYTFSYDADGKLLQQDLPNATKALLAYDNADRLTSYRNQTSTGSPLAEYSYTYNARNEKLTEDGTQGLWVYAYDPLGRLEQAHDPTTGRTRRYVFDPNSNRSEVRVNRGWSTAKGANDWVATPVPPPVPQTWSGNAQSFKYTLPFSFPFFGASYSDVWVSTSGYLTVGSATGSTGTTIDFANATFRAIAPYARNLTVNTVQADTISVQTPANNSFVRFRWRARVTGTSNLANFEVILASDGTITFNYQNMPASGTARVGVTPGNKVDFVAVPGFDRTVVPSNAQKITLTPAAESVQASYGYNALDQLTSGTSLSGITYNNDGEQTAITGPTPRGAWTFGYDGRGLMKTATSGANTTTWTLDGEGRVAKEQKSVEARYRYVSSGDAPAWQEDASGAITASFVSGPGGLLAAYSNGTPTFYLMNGHGDVVQKRNLAGLLLEEYAYDENGNPISAQTPTDYGFTGKWQKKRDPDTSLIRMGARMLDPLLGRFTSWDPVEDGGLSPYDYAGQDAINGYDLDGRCGWFGNPWNPCDPSNPKPKKARNPYAPRFFCGNVGCIAFQTHPGTGRVSIGAFRYGYTGGVFTGIKVFVNGRRVHGPPVTYSKGIFHTSIIAPPGSVVTVVLTYRYRCYFFWTCTAYSVPNAYRVPR